MFGWRVPAPNEAMLISGGKQKSVEGALPFKIVSGHGAFVLPVFRKASFLSLAMREAVVTDDCVTQQGITLLVKAVIAFKVGSDPASIAAAAQRFLDDLDPADIAASQEKFAKSESVGQRRMAALHGGRTASDARQLEVHPGLWAGVGLVRGGAGTAFVGSHTEVADLIEEYHAVGIDEFVLSGYPHLEEAYWFGEGVRPELIKRGLLKDSPS